MNHRKKCQKSIKRKNILGFCDLMLQNIRISKTTPSSDFIMSIQYKECGHLVRIYYIPLWGTLTNGYKQIESSNKANITDFVGIIWGW